MFTFLIREMVVNKNIAQKPFGEILREARKKRRWSRARLAKETGISENSIVRYEKAGIDDDGQFPPAPKLSVLAFELGLDPTEVLFGCLTGDEYEEYSNFHLQMHPYASPLFDHLSKRASFTLMKTRNFE